MRAWMLSALIVAIFAANSAAAETIMCPTQKEAGCADLLPANPMNCDRLSCNVVSRTSGGRKACLWSCAAHLDMMVNGVSIQRLLDVFKALSPQK
jgi:hypothetical protein